MFLVGKSGAASMGTQGYEPLLLVLNQHGGAQIQGVDRQQRVLLEMQYYYYDDRGQHHS